MCKVTPYTESTTACHGVHISLIYHALQCYITYIPRCGALIFTSSVVCAIFFSQDQSLSAIFVVQHERKTVLDLV